MANVVKWWGIIDASAEKVTMPECWLLVMEGTHI